MIARYDILASLIPKQLTLWCRSDLDALETACVGIRCRCAGGLRFLVGSDSADIRVRQTSAAPRRALSRQHVCSFSLCCVGWHVRLSPYSPQAQNTGSICSVADLNICRWHLFYRLTVLPELDWNSSPV